MMILIKLIRIQLTGNSPHGSVNSLTEDSPLTNLIRRMGSSRLPYAPADAEGDEQGDTNEDGRAEPQGNPHLMNVSLQPWLDTDVGNGEGYYSRC